jgi:CO/xanthine dehydrogenase Mo-binding subunit
VAFRLPHHKDPRAKAVIEAAAKAADWKPGQKGSGKSGRGIAFARYKTLATYVAVIVDLELDRDSGQIKVPRAYVAVDSGQIINPDGLTNQIEGGIVQSTSWTLHEQVRFGKAGILSQNWDSYPILTMNEAPSVTTVLIDRPNEQALGAGEAAQGPTAAAIANAFTAATGRRIRELPLHPDRVKAALA